MPEPYPTVTDHIQLWACTDCYFAYNEGDYTQKPDMHCQPFALFDLSDGTHTLLMRGISPGLMASEHAEDCAFRTSDGDEPCTYDGECEQISFSTRRCDTCGCHLSGTRHAMTQTYEESER